MYKIDHMELLGLVGEAGLCISWIPSGLLIEMAQNKLDTLRIQYEQQVSSLQRQLEAERRNNQEQMEQRQQEYVQLVSDLRTVLDKEQQEKLDEVISELTKVQTAEIQDLHAKYQHDMSVELTALKLSMEQIYISKLQLEMSDLKMRYDQRMDALNKEHKDDINRLTARSNNLESSVSLRTSLTEQYNQLVQRISASLEEMFPAEQNTVGNPRQNDDGVVNGDEENQVPSLPFSQDLHNLLLSQQQEISSLRSKLISEYESLLQSRTETMHSQFNEVSNLEEQMLGLQKQYDEQLRSIQEKIHNRDDELTEESNVQKEKMEQQYEELKSHYERRIQEMETTFEQEIESIKEKYEGQMSGFIHARLSDISGEERKQDENDMSSPSIALREYIHKTMAIAAVCDTDLDSVDTSSSAQVDLSVQLKVLESQLVDKDVQLKELMSKLESEELRSCSLDKVVTDLRQQLDNLQQQASDALSQCSELQESLLEKNSIIKKLELEKGESEKLYRDLLEKESSTTKSISREHFSGTSVDSFASTRDGISEDPSHILIDPVGNKLIVPDFHEEADRNGNGYELENSMLYESASFEYGINNSNSNNNNNSSSTSLEELVECLKKQVEELDLQLMEAKQRESELQDQIEEKEFIHRELIESLKQELDHERQVEIENLQSHFKIQLEIELKRQAAEFSAAQSVDLKSADQTGENVPENIPSSEAPSAEGITGLKNDVEHPVNAGMDTVTVQESQKPSESLILYDHAVSEADKESHDTLQEVSFTFYLQKATREATHAAPSDTTDFVDENIISENLSHHTKDTISALSSPVHDSNNLPHSTYTLSLEDMENEIQKIRMEYEEKIISLKKELQQAEEARTSLIFNHQQEIENICKKLNEAEEKYDTLFEGMQCGDHQELKKILMEQYDEELDNAKSVMQMDFDERLSQERKKFVEKHRKLMGEFMEDKEREENEVREKHREELAEVRLELTSEFEHTLKKYEQEIEILNHDLNLLKESKQQEANEDSVLEADRTLPEIDEITFSFQGQEMDVKCESPDSQDSHEASTPVENPPTCDAGVQYEESDSEADTHIVPTLQIRTFADVVKIPPPIGTQERLTLELRIQQLEAQIERLTQQLRESQRRESATSSQSSPSRSSVDSQKGDDSTLIAMLKSDLDRISAERESVMRTNDHLLSLLSESVKTYVGVEDTINRRLNQVVSGTRQSSGPQVDGSAHLGFRQGSVEPLSRPDSHGAVGFSPSDSYERKGVTDALSTATPDEDSSQDSHILENTSILSCASDEGLEISQRLAENIFMGPDLDAEGEEILTDARGRLQNAVSQLLELMEHSTIQLMEAKVTQKELLDTLASRVQEVEAANSRCSELDSQLTTEIEAKEYLVLELHKAQGLISGYSSERENLESQIQSLETQHERLIVELDTSRSLLQGLQQSQLEVDASREELNRQQQLLRQNSGQEIQAKDWQDSSPPAATPPVLLQEITSLSEDKKELSIQLQYQIDQARRRLTEQETAAEESERRHEAAIEERNQVVEDLQLQLENVERQLKASKAFVEEQMAEREQEREEHQREIESLEQMLDGKDRSASSQQRLQTEIADLTEQLQIRIASQTAMHQRILDLQKALEDTELSSSDLKAWVAQLESELDQRGNIEEQLKRRISRLEKQLTEKSEESSGTEEIILGDSVSKEEEGTGPIQESSAKQNLKINSISLKEELQKCQQHEEELEHENSALNEQVRQQLLQISGLRNQLDQLRNYGGNDESDTAQLRLKLQAGRDTVEKMEEKLNDAQNKIDNLEHILKSKEEEAEMIRTKVSKIIEMGDVQEENESLRSQLEELQSQISHLSNVSSLQTLPPELLVEKNHEIDELKHKLQLVEEELSQKIEKETAQEGTIHELDTRLKEKDEEISDLQDSIASLRRGEPCLDVSLPLNEETGNLLNISMTGRPTRFARAETPTSIQQELEESIAVRERDLISIQKELEQTLKDLEERDQNLKALREVVDAMNKEKENSQADKETVSLLEEKIHQKDRELYDLTLSMQELKHQVEELMHVQEELEKHLESRDTELAEVVEDRDKSQEQLHEKEDKLDQMVLQIESLHQEISSLTSFQHELQKDFDTVQSMLDEKERELENLSKEFTDGKVLPETLHAMLHLEKLVASLQKDLVEKQNVVDEKEEELYELHDKLEEMGSIKEELESTKAKLTEITEQLQKEQTLRLELQELLGKEKAAYADLARLRSTENEKEILSEVKVNDDIDKHIKVQENKIESLEQEILELKSEAALEVNQRAEVTEEANEEHDKILHVIEKQLQTQDINHPALQIEFEQAKIMKGENEGLKLQAEEKDTLIQHLKSQLNFKERELEEFSCVKQQLEETEEQLRLRQSALLDLQADKEQLLHDIGEVKELKLQLEAKENSFAELESQLRFRQTTILNLAAEKEQILEERNELEMDLKQQLQEKEKLLLDVQKKYDELKKGINEEVLQMEQDIHRSSQAQLMNKFESEKEVDELRLKLHESSHDLVDMTDKQKKTEERLSLISQQLIEREEQIRYLQGETQNFKPERFQPLVVSTEISVGDLEQQPKETMEKRDKEAVTVAELSEIIKQQEKKLEDLKMKDISRLDVLSPKSMDMSASLPLQESRFGIERIGLTRWDSEPTGLAFGNRDSVYRHFSIAEVERMARHQRKELSEKNVELEKLRQNLELWLKMGKGQDSLHLIIKEKETEIIAYQTELEMIRVQLKEKDRTITALRDQISSLKSTHYEELSSRDHLMTELQQEIYILKSSSDTSVSKNSAVQGESLSPETKQSISHLKMQLRKAHAALEEMQQGRTEEFEAGGGDASTLHKTSLERELEELRQKLRDREDELSVLKAKCNKELESTVLGLNVQHDQHLQQLKEIQGLKLEQILTEQKQALEKQHQMKFNELRLQHQKETHELTEERLDLAFKDQSTAEGEYPKFSINDDDMIPERLQVLLHHLNQLGEHLLSVSDLHYLQEHLAATRQRETLVDHVTCEEEKRSLMDSITALKELLKQADKVANMAEDEHYDWRAELLHSLVAVYKKEQSVLQAEVSTANLLYPEVDLIAQLETKVHNLEQIHQSGLDEMLRADRQSMANEIDSLHHRLMEAHNQLQENKDQINQRISTLEEAKSSGDWKLQRQIQMLEYKLQQEGVVREDLKKSLKLERQRVSELSSQSNQERSQILEMQSELSSTQINLSKVRDALEREQQRFNSVTDALEEERAKTIRLTELLDAAKRKLQSFQEELTEADTRHRQKVESEEGYIKELQTELKKERQRSIQFSDAEEKAKRDIMRLTDENNTIKRTLSSVQDEYKAEIEILHREQMEKDLQAHLGDNSETVSKLRELLEIERDSHQAAVEVEKDIARQLRREMDQLKSESVQLRNLYEAEKSRADSLKSDLDRTRSELMEKMKGGDADSAQMTAHQHLKIVEKDREELTVRVKELDEELSKVQDRAKELEEELNNVRSDQDLPSRSNGMFQRETINTLITVSTKDQELKLRLSQFCSKLQTLASQLHNMTLASHRYRGASSHHEHGDGEESDELVSVMSELRQLKSEIRMREDAAQMTENEASSSSAELVKLREHNQLLAEHIVKLKKEKDKVLDSLQTLETRLQATVRRDSHAQVNIPQYTSDTASDEDSVYDRTIWASERLSLQMALDSAEHEIQRLRSEIQQFKRLMTSNSQMDHTDPDKTSKLYGKYLRAESFRKALVYQKKYLLLLLGGYRDTEQETLAILASMGSFPSSHAGIYTRSVHTRAFMLFRSVGRVVIAVFRMKYMVKRWKRATRVGSPVVTGQINHQHAYIPSSSSYLSHQRHNQKPYEHQHLSNKNTHRSSSVDYISSLSSNGVSTVTSTVYQGPTAQSRSNSYTTPPTKDLVRQQKSAARGNRDEARRRILQDEEIPHPRYTPSASASARPHRVENDDDNFLQYLENIQQELSEGNYSCPSTASRHVAWR